MVQPLSNNILQHVCGNPTPDNMFGKERMRDHEANNSANKMLTEATKLKNELELADENVLLLDGTHWCLGFGKLNILVSVNRSSVFLNLA